MAALPLLTGLGGGRGGCLTPWDEALIWVEDGASCAETPADDTDRTGLEAGGAFGEEYWTGLGLDGTSCCRPSLPGSGAELSSHFGGDITECFGGSRIGSR